MNYTSLAKFKRDLPAKWKKELTIQYNNEFPPTYINNPTYGRIKKTKSVTHVERLWLYDFIGNLLEQKLAKTQDETLCMMVCKLEEDLGPSWQGLDPTTGKAYNPSFLSL